MAIGDTAAAAGLPLVAGTVAANTLETVENETRDFIGRIILDHPRKITAGPTAPASPQEGDIWMKG